MDGVLRKRSGSLGSRTYEGTLHGYQLIAAQGIDGWTVWICAPDGTWLEHRYRPVVWFKSYQAESALFAARAWIEAHPLK